MEAKYLSKYFSAIYRKSKREFNRQFEQRHHIKATQGDILMFIHEHPNLLQKDIAAQMAIDSSLMVRNLNALAEQGFVIRAKDQDQRANHLTLTPAGTRVATELSANMAAWWQDFFQDLPEVDPEVLSRYLYLTYEKMRTLDANKGGQDDPTDH